MPTSGTHITIVQRLALDPRLQPLLGNPAPNAEQTDPTGALRIKYACLGAVGPDILYAMADYSADLQDLENFLMKVNGTFACMSELMDGINEYTSGALSQITLGVTESLEQSFGLVMGVIKNGILALLVDAGYNFWPVFEAKRQLDRPREEWYWADYLHYIRSGRFVRKLLEKSAGNGNLQAYALGYMTHYVVDVVGHPYVNQVVQGPFRLYWQRHHLVENFIDSYVWDRWHQPSPKPQGPTTQEQPADVVTTTPNPMGKGAPFTYARLHDLITIGLPNLDDPVDQLVQNVCNTIKAGTFAIGIAEQTEMPEPTDTDFRAWGNLVAESIREVYDELRHPKNLEKVAASLGTTRPEGYPTGSDVTAAYSMIRLVLKLSTEENVEEPKPPMITTDISQTVEQLQEHWQELLNDLGDIPPPPTSSSEGTITPENILEAIKNAVDWLADVAEAVAEAVFDFVKNTINTVGTAVSEVIKYALYLLNRALYAVYRSLRDVLVLSANAVPFTDDLMLNRSGTFNTSSLWQSIGNLGKGKYPVEEIPSERKYTRSDYAPFLAPNTLTNLAEQPPVDWAAPYGPAAIPSRIMRRGQLPSPALPDDFIDGPLGPDDMFLESGPQQPVPNEDPDAPTIASTPRNFGGAMANCRKAIDLATAPQPFPGPYMLPDYSLDGDRGYAWPCWDVNPEVAVGAPEDRNDPQYDAAVPVPLSPADRRNQVGGTDGEARVRAVPVSG